MRAGARVPCIAAAILLFCLPAAAQAPAKSTPPSSSHPPPGIRVLHDCPPPEEPRDWPDEGERRSIHLFTSGSFGSCTRDGAGVGGTGLCGEVTPIGIDVPIPALRQPFRFALEAAFGATSAKTATDALGVLKGTGGPYLVLRPSIGFDITRRFYVRVGPQVRAAWTLSTVSPAVAGMVELGTRFGSYLEIGPRAFLGADDIVRTSTEGTRHDFTVAFGTTLVVRVFLR